MAEKSVFEGYSNNIVDILSADDVPPEWFIPDMFLQGGFYSLVGESGAGKSYISYTMALAIASGSKGLSGIIPAGDPKTVLYFDDENSVQDRNKYLKRAWLGLTYQNGEEPDLGKLIQHFWPFDGKLGGEDWPDVLADAIRTYKPHAVFFDTANACFGIDDENANGEAGQVIREVKRLLRTVDPAVAAVILKHAKTRTEKGQIRTMRGAKIWKDQSDGVLFQVKGGGRPRLDGLSLTRLIPDKVRAYGLQKPIYITPRYIDAERTGLMLDASYKPGKEHLKSEAKDE